MRMPRMAIPLLIGLLACSESTPPPTQQSVVDPALVGTWVGMIQNPAAQQSGTLTMMLNGDGSMSATVNNPIFNPVPNGTWNVTGTQFNGRGNDTQGTLIIFQAPRSETQLSGSWNAQGTTGTFSVDKQ